MKRRIATPLRPRRAERLGAPLPLRLAGGLALMRSGSVESIYFEIDTATETGSAITFEIDIETPLGRMTLKCTGLVVGSGRRGTRSGIAVHILESRLETADN